MELSLILSNDSGSFSAILGQFIETAVAETLQDRILAQQAAQAAQSSAQAAATSEEHASADATNAAMSAASAGTDAAGASASATSAAAAAATATTEASSATTAAANAAGSATSAAGSAASAAASATNAQNSANQAASTLANALLKTNNLSDVSSAATARGNLGLGDAATHPVGDFLQTANNLSDVANSAAARGNLSAAESGANGDITGLTGLTTPLSVAQGGTGINALIPVAQCYLSLSGSNLLLSRRDGCVLTINDAHHAIPSAGVTLAPTGTTANTLYYVYAFMSGAAMTLEAVTTAYAVDASSGMPIKSGDATRTLVGLARTFTAGSWTPGAQQLNLLSYWNRRERSITQITTATTTSASFVQIAQVLAISWADDLVDVFGQMSANLAVSNGTSVLTVSKNSAIIGAQTQTSYEQVGFSRVTFTHQPIQGAESVNSLYQMNVLVSGGSGPTLNASLVELTVRVRG